MTTNIPLNGSEDTLLKIWNCVVCRRRKVKCDRREPCSNCVRLNIDCHYPVGGRLPRRSKEAAAATWESPAQKQAELLGRLRRLEAVVTELTAQVEEGSSKDSSAEGVSAWRSSVLQSRLASSGDNAGTEVHPPDIDELDEEFGSLVIDKAGTLQIGKGFWTIFCGEVDNIFQAVQDVAMADQSGLHGHRSPAPDTNDASTHPADLTQNLLFGYSTGSQNSYEDLCPLPSQVPFLWQIFVHRVDPFIKVLHIPTMDNVVHNLSGKFSSESSEMSSLLFSISLAAIVSLAEEEVLVNFGESKTSLLFRLRTGTEKSLAHAGLLLTQSTTTIRAFTIYLFCLKFLGNDAQQLVWPLVGLLLRIAKSAGLQHEAQSLHQSPNISVFELEMNRRLWWHICFLDSGTRDLQRPDLSLAHGGLDMKFPACIDDSELNCNTTYESINRSSTKSTAMSITLIRCEIWLLSSRLASNQDGGIHLHLQLIQVAWDSIEASCLRYLHAETNSFDSLVKTMAALFFARVKQVTCSRHLQTLAKGVLPSNAVAANQPIAKALLSSSFSVIAAINKLRTQPTWAKWSWQLRGHIPWYAMGAVLSHICSVPWNTDAERAWLMTKRMFDSLPADAREHKKWEPISVMVKYTERFRLASRAQMPSKESAAYEEGLCETETDCSSAVAVQTNTPALTAELHSQTDGFEFLDFTLVNDPSSEFLTSEAFSIEQQQFANLEAIPMDWQAWDDPMESDYMWDFSWLEK